MTLDDVKKKIWFQDIPAKDWHLVKRRAGINLHAEVSISPHGHPPIKEIDEMLTRKLLSSLYDDRRQEIRETLFELYLSDPFNRPAWQNTLDKLQKQLGYGPPL